MFDLVTIHKKNGSCVALIMEQMFSSLSTLTVALIILLLLFNRSYGRLSGTEDDDKSRNQ
jgi:hypothetical protein